MILFALSSPPFYTTYVHLPTVDDAVPSQILSNPKFFPFFEGAIGAMDGTHINFCPTADARHLARDRKGGVSQNTLACCSFDMRFQYILSGMDGCTADASMYNDARLTDLKIPEGKYYLADAGFGICDSLLVPYRGVRYHLAEWGRASVRYVLCILSEQSSTILHMSDLQTRKNCSTCDMPLPEMLWSGYLVFSSVVLSFLFTPQNIVWRSTLAATHNFIRDHDADEILDFEDPVDTQPGDYGVLGEGPARRAEVVHAMSKRDQIASAMWRSYQMVTEGMGLE